MVFFAAMKQPHQQNRVPGILKAYRPGRSYPARCTEAGNTTERDMNLQRIEK